MTYLIRAREPSVATPLRREWSGSWQVSHPVNARQTLAGSPLLLTEALHADVSLVHSMRLCGGIHHKARQTMWALVMAYNTKKRAVQEQRRPSTICLCDTSYTQCFAPLSFQSTSIK